MEKMSLNDNVIQSPIIGVYPININDPHQAKDGGSCKFEKIFIKTHYLDGNGNDSGYYIPGGNYLSFKQFNGGHQIWLDNFQLKKGLTYTLSFWLKTNNFKNPWNKGAGKVSSEKAMFSVRCVKFVSGMLETGKNVLTLTLNDHNPALQKYVSSPYTPQEDQLVSIVIHPWLYDRNGYLWDFAYPQIQWRA